MSTPLNPLRWAEHVLAVAGFAWLVNWTIELLSLAVGRHREIAKLNREMDHILKQLWLQQRMAQQKAYTMDTASVGPRMQPTDSARELSETEALKQQVALAQWASSVAWKLCSSTRHKDALTALYTRAGRTFLLQQGEMTPDDLRSIAESALRHDPRPNDVVKGLLYDVSAMYLQACQMSVDSAAAVAIVPMVMEEHVKSPKATTDELLERWRLRVQEELETYQPTFPQGK